MSRLRRLEILDPFTHYSYSSTSSIFAPFFLEKDELVEDLASFASFLHRPEPDPVDLFETVTDLIRVERAHHRHPAECGYRRVAHHRVRRVVDPERLLLEGLVDRVSALEERFVREEKERERERKCTWTAEIKGPGEVERKYQWSSVSEGKKERKYKWTAEIKGSGEHSKKYTFEVSNAEKKKDKKEDEDKKKDKKKKVGSTSGARLVEIEGPSLDHGAIVLRQAFAKRAGVLKAGKGKYKELSPQDAALLIQMTFRAYLIRRSQALRALRELAIAKAKLKEIRASFNNFSYRRQIARDAVECQRFSEKIIVLLLTVDAIEGADVMVRAAKRSMVDELEAMLDVVDPQPAGKLMSMRRRTFDMPDGVIRKEIAESVAQVVQMLDGEEHV